MEYYLNDMDWSGLVTITLLLGFIYFMLSFAENIIYKVGIFGKISPAVRRATHLVLVVFEPIYAFIVMGCFVLIHPIPHGFLVAVVLLASFNPIKNYINGRTLQFDKSIAIGQRLRIQDLEGIIYKINRMGLQIKSNKGLHFVNFSSMSEQGYTLLSGEEIGGFYHLKISPVKLDSKVNYTQELADLLATAPYLDWNIKPEISTSDATPALVSARVVVKEETHLHELVRLIKEWGFTCTVHE